MTGCDSIREELSAYLDGELAPPAQDEVREHLAGCESCRAEHAGLVELTLATEALPRLTAPPHFTAQVMALVVEEPVAAPAAAPAATRRGASGRAPQQPRAVAAEPALPPGCVADEDLSALLDAALPPAEAARAAAHLPECARCRDVHAGLERIRDGVRALPRLEVPPGFASAVQEKIAIWEREEERRAQLVRAARARWWTHAGWAARAAGFLLLVGVGASLSTPARRDPQGTGSAGRARPQLPSLGRSAPATAEEKDVPSLPGGSYDAVVELSTGAFESASGAARAVVEGLGQVEAQRATPRSWACVVHVPANKADDLLRGLAAIRDLDAGREVEDLVSRVSTELDRVELRSGHVLVGRVSPRRDGGVVLRLGSLTQEVSQGDLLRVDRAQDDRRLRIEVRARD